MKKAGRLKGWRLYATVAVLGYPLLFGLLWSKETVMAQRWNGVAQYSYWDVSLPRVAFWSAAGVAVCCLFIFVDTQRRNK